MKKEIKVYMTAKDCDARLSFRAGIPFVSEKESGKCAGNLFDPKMNMALKDSSAINVYPEMEYQTILGFGGAMTEAAALNIRKLPDGKGEELLESYFSREKGIGYHFCRTHINSSDFGEASYDYVEEGDIELKTFTLKRDEEIIFPIIKSGNRYAENEIEILATPWSPPAWMKDNNNRCEGGKLKPEYYQLWADYFVRYIKGARAKGMNVTMVSIQNEPQAFVTWDGCLYNAEEERDFLKDYLGPTLKNESLGDVKILIWDHNKDLIVERVKTIMSDKDAAKYVWGAAFHWYAGDHFFALDIVHEMYPELVLFYTEGCNGGVYRKTGQWCAGEIFAHEMFGNLNHWTSACIDWNLVLDEHGGPSYAENYCDAPILADISKGTFGCESTYYYIGHFSKYVERGAKRIGSSCFTDKLEVCAFKNPDGMLVLVVMNPDDDEKETCIRCQGDLAVVVLPAHSIVTLIF